MTVQELIQFLQTQPQNIKVAFCQYSDYTAMELDHISLSDLQCSRVDGYVGPWRSDKPSEQWLVFPGN